jgi:HAD superfamily hydrolase (TIGR01549 family)
MVILLMASSTTLYFKSYFIYDLIMIKAVILDFGDTLVEGGINYKEYHEAVLRYLNGIGFNISLKEVKSALSQAIGRLNKMRAKGKEQTFEEVYEFFLRSLAIPGDAEILGEIHDIFKKYYVSNFFHCTGDVLKELSKRYMLALLSNTMSDKPYDLLRDYGFMKYFDVVVCSRDLGIRKPNPNIFRHVLDKLCITPAEAVHVGDSIKADMKGASGVGITGIWIKVPGEEPWHGYAINSICELPSLLLKINSC